jgi:hypothetical protein
VENSAPVAEPVTAEEEPEESDFVKNTRQELADLED